MQGFIFDQSFFGSTDLERFLQIAPSLQVNPGDALKLDANSKLAFVAATDKCDYVANTLKLVGLPNLNATSTPLGPQITSGAADFTYIRCTPAGAGDIIYATSFVPLTTAVDPAVVSSTTTSVTFVLTAGASNDLQGGLIYIPQLDETHTIISNSYAGGNVTINVNEPWGWSVATPNGVTLPTTYTVRVVPWGFKSKTVQFGSTPQRTISNTIAGATGGNIIIHDVDMKRMIVKVRFAP